MLATQSIARGRGNAAIDERVAQIDANGVVTFMHNDKQNSVIAISDTAGNPVVRRGYGTYGETNPAQMTGPTSAGSSAHPFGYSGRRWDNDLGLYYYRARWYDPQLGTFLETDPIGSLDYVNLYAYVGLEPGNGTDPSGMQVVGLGGGGEVGNSGGPAISQPIMRNWVNSYSSHRPDRGAMFFSHLEVDAAFDAVMSYRDELASRGLSEPLTIVGLSLGGPATLKLAGKFMEAGITPNLLVTLDPVGFIDVFRYHNILGPDPEWRNIKAESGWPKTGGDWAAILGSRSGGAVLADTFAIVDTYHENIDAMMSARATEDGQSAYQRIDQIYRNCSACRAR